MMGQPESDQAREAEGTHPEADLRQRQPAPPEYVALGRRFRIDCTNRAVESSRSLTHRIAATISATRNIICTGTR
ncbi:hypothetical protein GCM10029976_025360 [Kribbella albertanoniae]